MKGFTTNKFYGLYEFIYYSNKLPQFDFIIIYINKLFQQHIIDNSSSQIVQRGNNINDLFISSIVYILYMLIEKKCMGNVLVNFYYCSSLVYLYR